DASAGTGTSTLDIAHVYNKLDCQFYCRVKESGSTCYQASNAVRLNIDVVTWDGSDWLPTPPDNTKVAVIDGTYNLVSAPNGETSFEACSLVVNPGFRLTVGDNTYVTVVNDVIVYGSGSNLDGILVTSKGSFVQQGDDTSAGSFTLSGTSPFSQVDKTTAPMNDWYEYTYWSSPANGVQIGDAFTDAHPTRRFWFDASQYNDAFYETGNNNTLVLGAGIDDIDDEGDDWQYIGTGNTVTNSDNLIPGVGYATNHNPAFFTGPGSPPYQFSYSFRGTFNTGYINVPVLRNTVVDYNDWNFIGNPYPSAINSDLFLTQNTYDATTNPNGM